CTCFLRAGIASEEQIALIGSPCQGLRRIVDPCGASKGFASLASSLRHDRDKACLIQEGDLFAVGRYRHCPDVAHLQLGLAARFNVEPDQPGARRVGADQPLAAQGLYVEDSFSVWRQIKYTHGTSG